MTLEETQQLLHTIREDIEVLKDALECDSERERRLAIERVLSWVPKLMEMMPPEKISGGYSGRSIAGGAPMKSAMIGVGPAWACRMSGSE